MPQPPAISRQAVQRLRTAQRGERADAAEHQREADRPVRDHADREDHEVGHDDVDGVLGAAEPGLDHGEAGLHEEDEGAAEDHEEEVQRAS